MYVDDSGNSTLTDRSRYYLLSGIIVHNNNIKLIQKTIFDFKYTKFKNSYLEAEIHTHDMFRNKNEFIDLSDSDEKHRLFKDLYTMIGSLPITVISSVIDKNEMNKQYPTWKIFKMAWIVLTYRFNQYLDSLQVRENGVMKIDKGSSKEKSELDSIIKDLRRENKKYRRIDNIPSDPIYVHSGASEGIQVADAVAYCTTKRLAGNKKFPPYWDLIKDKMYHKKGKILGNGLNIFPFVKEIPSEDIQP